MNPAETQGCGQHMHLSLFQMAGFNQLSKWYNISIEINAFDEYQHEVIAIERVHEFRDICILNSWNEAKSEQLFSTDFAL